MLTELYIAALLVDEELADAVWALWNLGLISDETATWAWLFVASQTSQADCHANVGFPQ